MIVIVMGVTGAGKTTVGRALSSLTGWPFAEGDDYHSEVNKQKMHAGIPLDDEDRKPWLESLHQLLLGWFRSGSSGILACSALKQSYRDMLVEGMPPNAYRFVLLEAPRAVLEERLHQRAGHYMNPALLDSQIATLETPGDAIRMPDLQSPEDVAKNLLQSLNAS
jgi:gluconokinase